MKTVDEIRLWRGASGPHADVVYRSADGRTWIEPLQHLMRHSLTGIEWGYGGSGPADLARSILLLFVAPEEAEQMYQGFKWDVISTLPWSGGTISADRVQAWIAAQRAEEAWAERDAEPAPRRRRAEEMG